MNSGEGKVTGWPFKLIINIESFFYFGSQEVAATKTSFFTYSFSSYLQTLTSAWQLWIAAWLQPRLAMWTICAKSSEQNTSQLALNRRRNQASATGGSATRLCADSSTASPLTTRTSCSSVHVRTRRVQSGAGRQLCPVALMKRQKNPAASHRWGSAMLTMCAG